MNGAMDLKRAPPPQATARWGVVVVVCLFGALVGVGAGGFAYMRLNKNVDGADVKGLGPTIDIPTLVGVGRKYNPTDLLSAGMGVWL